MWLAGGNRNDERKFSGPIQGPDAAAKNGLSALFRSELGLCFVAFAISKRGNRIPGIGCGCGCEKNGFCALIRIEFGLCFVGFAISKRGNRFSVLATVAAAVSEFDSNWILAPRHVATPLKIWSSQGTLADSKRKKYPLEYGFSKVFDGNVLIGY